MKLSIYVVSLLLGAAAAIKTKTVTVSKCKKTKTLHGSTVTVPTTVTVSTTATDTLTSSLTTTVVSTVTVTATPSTTSSSTTTTTTTPFTGKGSLLVYPTPFASKKGCLISGGVWYAGGGSCATYTANAVDETMGTFNLTSSKGPCIIDSTSSQLNCSNANAMGSVFGQTSDGNLTYSSSAMFYAAATATGTTQQPIFATQAPVTLEVMWAGISS